MTAKTKSYIYLGVGFTILAVYFYLSRVDVGVYFLFERTPLETLTAKIIGITAGIVFILHVIYSWRKAVARRQSTGERKKFWLWNYKEVLLRLAIVFIPFWMSYGMVYNACSWVNRSTGTSTETVVKGRILKLETITGKQRWGYRYVVVVYDDSSDRKIRLLSDSWDFYRYLKVDDMFERRMNVGSLGVLYERK